MRRSLLRLPLLALLALTAAVPTILLHPAPALADDDDDDDGGYRHWRRHHHHRHWRDRAEYYYVRPPRDRVIVYDRPYYVEPPRPVYVAPAPGITVNIPLRFD